MLYIVFIFILSCLALLGLCLYADRTNKCIDIVFFSTDKPDNDEAQIRYLLFLYPRAEIIVPESDINIALSRSISRVTVQ